MSRTVRLPCVGGPTRLVRADLALARVEARVWSEARAVAREVKRGSRAAYAFCDARVEASLRQRANLASAWATDGAKGVGIALAWYALGTVAT